MGEALYRLGKLDQATEYLQRALSYVSKPLRLSPREIGPAIICEIIVQIAHRLLPDWFAKTSEKSVNPAVEEELRILENLAYIGVSRNPKHFLLSALRILNFSERNGLIHGIVGAYAGLAVVASFLSFFWISGYYGRKGLVLAQRTKYPGSLGLAYQAMAAHELISVRFGSAIDYGLKAAEVLRNEGYWNLRVWGTSARLVATAMHSQGNFATALNYAQELVKFGEDSNDRLIWCWGLAEGGRVQRVLGRLEEATSNLKRAVELAAEVPDNMYRVRAGAYLADCHLQHGDVEQSQRVLEECELIRRQHKVSGPFYLQILNGLAHTYMSAAEQNVGSQKAEWLKKVRAECKQALKLAKSFQYGRAEALRHRGTYEWLSDKPASAQRWWGKSQSVAEMIGMRFELGLTHLEMAHRLKDLKHLEQAEKIFTEIGAEFELAETKKFLQELSE